ncbi:MAG: TIGR03960 family B12-binding radical SAM protein [Clostridia bacterium]|nr:TIGR03960 family B12-binding radical SAM protein [Clostridia bacterium]
MIPERLQAVLDQVEKPGRYIGGEFNEIIKDKEGKTRVAFCFPDTYEIGMSNLGMKILYGVLNEMENVWCERVFAPWPDMGDLLRRENVPLYALESGDSIRDFDFCAFTMQYELCYTTVLYMLDLAGIPFRAKDRGEHDPILLCGGPCTYNPEPFADFFDIMSIGEGEEALPELMRLYEACKKAGKSKAEFLREASHLDGFYVPSLYDVTYSENGSISSFSPKFEDVPAVIKKRIVKDFEHSFYPTSPVIPHVEAVHDRTVLEVFRGCIRGCRFCQAGMTCRPIRERSPEKLNELARKATEGSGYPEISMCALSISDYSGLSSMCEKLLSWCPDEKIRLSLPSMRVDSFSQKIMDEIPGLKKGSFTFAPEAGTQRLRDVIHKGVTEEDITRTMNYVFSAGMCAVKLYFIDGLPNETDDDVKGIAELAQRIVNLYYQNPDKPKGKSVNVNISVSCFIPKPQTPFQWAGQNSLEEVERKQKLVRENITTRKVSYNWHDARSSRVEAVLARGDRRLSEAIVKAYEKGQRFDSWDEYFSLENWESAISEAGLDSSFYANREIPADEILPWDHISALVSKKYLLDEYRKAMNIL